MKTFLSLLSLLSLAGLLMTTGCTVEEHRGGYYGPHEYGHGYYYHGRGHDWDDHDWDDHRHW